VGTLLAKKLEFGGAWKKASYIFAYAVVILTTGVNFKTIRMLANYSTVPTTSYIGPFTKTFDPGVVMAPVTGLKPEAVVV